MKIKCKICGNDQLEYYGGEYKCYNTGIKWFAHYSMFLGYIETWYTGPELKFLQQNYELNTTFISLYLLRIPTNLELDYLLVDFDKFNEEVWLNKIEMIKFYA